MAVYSRYHYPGAKIPYKSPYGQNYVSGFVNRRVSRDTSNNDQSASGGGNGPVSRLQSKFERTMDQFSPWD